MSQSNDLNELINTITKALNEIIEEKYNEIKNEEYKRLLKLSQAISYSAVQEEEKKENMNIKELLVQNVEIK